MSRISLIQSEAASSEVREIYDTALRGKPGNIQKALAHRPDMLAKFLPFYASVGRSLERRLFELIYLRTSLINQCHYCTQHHLASSKRAGLGREDWIALKSGDYSRFSAGEQAALGYAEKLTCAPNSLTDSDFAALKAHFSDQQIMDLHMLTGLANLTNRVTGPLALEVEFPEEVI